MTFKVHKERKVLKTTIKGKVLTQSTCYYVFRSVFFGLGRLYLRLSPDYYHGHETEYGVNYTIKEDASKFSKEEAEMLVRDLKNNPDKFVRYL
jgi:hypothetical protein